MRWVSRTPSLCLLLALGSLTLAGCGSGALPKGQVLMNGKPYPFADGEQMSLTFTSTGDKKGSASADVGKDGAFTVKGKGLPAGPCRISVISAMTGPNVPDKEKYQDKLKGAFSGANSPLTVDIGSEPTLTLEIDLGTKKVAKK